MEHIRELQFGFRKGRSTAEAIFLVRRLQDLVDAKKHQVLYLLFIDWSKAFDKIRPDALRTAFEKLKVLKKLQAIVAQLIKAPLIEVIMGEDVSATYTQSSGIRQSCTLSPYCSFYCRQCCSMMFSRVTLLSTPLQLHQACHSLISNSQTKRFSLAGRRSTCRTCFRWFRKKPQNAIFT